MLRQARERKEKEKKKRKKRKLDRQWKRKQSFVQTPLPHPSSSTPLIERARPRRTILNVLRDRCSRFDDRATRSILRSSRQTTGERFFFFPIIYFFCTYTLLSYLFVNKELATRDTIFKDAFMIIGLFYPFERRYPVRIRLCLSSFFFHIFFTQIEYDGVSSPMIMYRSIVPIIVVSPIVNLSRNRCKIENDKRL